MIYLGSPVFKIARLLFIAMFSVHLFACIFFRVKIASATTPEDVTSFYTSKNVDKDVCTYSKRVQFIIFGCDCQDMDLVCLHSLFLVICCRILDNSM
jgi:hypothetical protein